MRKETNVVELTEATGSLAPARAGPAATFTLLTGPAHALNQED